jgi:raffinose/stachyose/melibiose transport system permease protein
MSFLSVYTIVTLFPFYVLFVRSFVGTRDAADLHIWLPPRREISLEAEMGNLSIYYNLDIQQVKEDLGIPWEEYIPARTSLREIAERYDIPIERLQAYFAPYARFGGWLILLSGGKLWRPLVRTVVITLASLVGLNVLSILTGCGLAGLRRRDQMAIYNLYLLQMVIPPMLIITPQFLIVQWLLKLIPGTAGAGFSRYTGQILLLVLINVKGGAVSTMIFTSYIGRVPRELEEAAKLDGASRLQYLQHVLMPLLKVPIASLTVIALAAFWNQFLEPYVYLDLENHTLLPLIQTYSGIYSTNYQAVYTAMLVSMLPLVTLYVLFRRAFIQGALTSVAIG